VAGSPWQGRASPDKLANRSVMSRIGRELPAI